MKEGLKKTLITLLVIVLIIGGMLLVYFQYDNINRLFKKDNTKDGYVIAKVGLSPIGMTDEKGIDLSANPVRIILNNEKHNYQFTFDKNSQLKTQKSKSVEIGEYTYTILSKQLLFEDVTGTITIDKESNILTFNYTLELNQPLIFNIKINDFTHYNSLSYVCLYSESSNVDKIRNILPSNNTTYIVGIYCYDKSGILVESFEHTHKNTAPADCWDNWTSSKLEAGTNYTVQLRFTSQEDPQKTYLSDIANVILSDNEYFEVEYTVVENQI